MLLNRFKTFCARNKDSCLDCRKLDPSQKKDRCIIFRTRYERKKASTQEERYERALEDVEKQEYSKLSMDEIKSKVIMFFDKFYNHDKDTIYQDIMAIVLERELKIRIGHNKQVRLKKQIRYNHPELFDIVSSPNKDTPDSQV